MGHEQIVEARARDELEHRVARGDGDRNAGARDVHVIRARPRVLGARHVLRPEVGLAGGLVGQLREDIAARALGGQQVAEDACQRPRSRGVENASAAALSPSSFASFVGVS